MAAGASNNSNLVASLDTASVGAKSGTATVSFASDSAGSSGFGASAIGDQVVNLSGAVYGYAQAGLSSNSLDFGARRVGDLAARQTLTVSNLAANDDFHEGLNATLGAAPVGFSTSGNTAISNLAAGSSADATVTLASSTAGVFRRYARCRARV